MRFDDGGPAFLLESVEGGERLGRYSFLGVGPRRLLTVRDGSGHDPVTRPVGVSRLHPRSSDPRRSTLRIPLTALRHFLPKRRILPVNGHPALPRRRRRSAGLRRRLHLRADGAAAGEGPDRRADGRVPGDGPGPRLRPPDPHAVGRRVAPHGGARISRAATRSPSEPSSKRSSVPAARPKANSPA